MEGRVVDDLGLVLVTGQSFRMANTSADFGA